MNATTRSLVKITFIILLGLPFCLRAQISTRTPEQQAADREENRRYHELERQWNRQPELAAKFMKDFPSGLNFLKAKWMHDTPQDWIDYNWHRAINARNTRYSRRLLDFARRFPNTSHITQAREWLSVDVNNAKEVVLDQPTAACVEGVSAAFKRLSIERDHELVFRDASGKTQSASDFSWVVKDLTKVSSIVTWAANKSLESTQVEERDYFDLRSIRDQPTGCLLVLRHVIANQLSDCTCKQVVN